MIEEFRSCAKWILSGEHTVTRGGKALAFPLKKYENRVVFEKSGDRRIVAAEENTVARLLDAAAKFSGITPDKVSGHIFVESNIPTKVGFGSSAAICVNIAKLFEHCGACGDVFALARNLENKFHKKSSGLDVAAVLKNKPVVFRNNEVKYFLEPKFQPRLFLTASGETSSTSECARIVEEFFRKNEKLALESDEQMESASDLCEDALKNADFRKLRDGMMLANEVFHRWGLCTPAMSFHMDILRQKGAVAVKPAGSGLGGCILSLWEEDCAFDDPSALDVFADRTIKT
ncbi:MAG: hypothetical protein LBO73_04210 [Holosporaceae bacterium]|jgi:mevalonate kinase|nr:hypothetical protein [Holosporaceae bacterium]